MSAYSLGKTPTLAPAPPSPHLQPCRQTGLEKMHTTVFGGLTALSAACRLGMVLVYYTNGLLFVGSKRAGVFI